jgi:apolipoprotein N-acyltransferase
MAARNRRRVEPTVDAEVESRAALSRRTTVQHLWWLLFGGCLTFLAFPYRTTPDSELWLLAWVGLAPLLWTLHGITPRRAFAYGAFAGFVINFGGFWWMSTMFEEFGHLPAVVAWALTVLNALYQGGVFACFAAAAVWFGRRRRSLPGPLVLASTFTAVEYLYPMVFPWYLGNSQHPFTAFVQVADLTGVYGVTFCVVLGNALLGSAVARLRGRPIARVQVAVAVVLLLASLGYSSWRLTGVDAAAAAAPTLDIGMVEADIGIWEKEAKGLTGRQKQLTVHGNLLKHQAMSRELAKEGADLIVWPESSYFPLGDVYGKRNSAFAVGVGQGGRLALWRDLGSAGFDWSLGPPLVGQHGVMRAVAASREDAVCAVGDHGHVEFWDGRRLRPVPLQRLAGGNPPALFGVAVGARRGAHADEDGVEPQIWAVGQHGHVYMGDAGGLELIPTGLSTVLRAVTVVGSGRALAVGDAGVILELGERTTTPVATSSKASLFAVTYEPRSQRVWVAGADGTILMAERAGWSRERSGVDVTLRALVSSSDGVWAVGDHGTVVHRNATGTWEREPVSTSADFTAVTLDPRGTVLAADRQGSMWRRVSGEGGTWERLDAPGIGPLTGMSSLGYVRMEPIPRDTRYLYQARSPGPTSEAFLSSPKEELATALADRTAVQRGFTTPILFGAISWERPARTGEANPRRLNWNTAVLLDDMGRILGMYDKYQLLAFGEYIPLGDWFPSFYDWIPEAGRFEAGDDVGAFSFLGYELGLMICYEDILTRFAARLASLEPHVLLNITNDAWFGHTSEPYLHLNLAMMRAIETHRPLLRSTNTGVSTVVDPAGRLLQQTALEDPERLLATVPMMSIDTVYARIGDLFAHLTLLHMLVLFIARRRPRGA